MTGTTRNEKLIAAFQDIAPDTPGSFNEELIEAAKALGISGNAEGEAEIGVLQACLGSTGENLPGLLAQVPGGELPTAQLRACEDETIRTTENGTVRRTES